ncbi:MAG: sulfite exporter TauE/SafE family protein [Actinomycetota bacterium]
MHVTLLELVAIALLGIISGTLGAITGIGGGVIIVPTLVLVFGFDFPTAVAASLAAVIATSTTTGGAYVGEGLTNMRLAMTLEVATTIGGISGGLLGILLPERVLAGLFATAMAATAFLVAKGRTEHHALSPDEREQDREPIPPSSGALDARYFDTEANRKVVYHVERVPLGMSVSYGAGIMSGLLGVGGGFIKVPAMNLVMGVPIKVAAATSNFMIGVTAVSSFLVYLGRGEVHPAATTPLILGTIVGSLAGVRLHRRTGDRPVQLTLAAILLFVTLQMTWRALGVGVG